MLKYTIAQVTFAEVPDEVSLTIELSNCPYHCPECHSKELWEDIGAHLTSDRLCDLIDNHYGISCICFMGGDSSINELYRLFSDCHILYPNLKIAWYTGRNSIPEDLPECVDFIKIGPYKKECGPLNNPNTNQRFYTRGRNMKKMDVSQKMWYDTTDKFWKNEFN